MPSYPETLRTFNYQNALAPFAQGENLPFDDVLTLPDVERILTEENVSFGQTPGSFWTSPLVLFAQLWQVLNLDKSCRQVVLNVLMTLAGEVLPKKPDADQQVDTGMYCRARAKMPVGVYRKLTVLIGQRLEAAAPASWHWHDRPVKLIDGSTSTLPDTEENQQVYPQPTSQKKGLGYPLIRWVIIIGLATATIQDFAYGRYAGKKTGEMALLRQLVGGFRHGEIVLADRYYCSYFMVALLRRYGVNVVTRLNQRRNYDFTQGEMLGEKDHIVVWPKPDRPEWMSAAEYAQMPPEMRMREIYHEVTAEGCRVQEMVLATTLLDAAAYSAKDIKELYSKRWQVELDIRSLKTMMGMYCLSCKTPFMVAKEIWAHLLAYNLVRKVGAQVAKQIGVPARTISFTAVKQAILAGWQKATWLEGAAYVRLEKAMLKMVRKEKVGDRPGRNEPRAVKRRPKCHKVLTEARAKARAKLLKGKLGKVVGGPSKKAG